MVAARNGDEKTIAVAKAHDEAMLAKFAADLQALGLGLSVKCFLMSPRFELEALSVV